MSQVDVGDPQGGQLTEPQTGPYGDPQQVSVRTGEPGCDVELSLGEEAQIRLGLLDPAALRRSASARVGAEEALLDGVAEDAVQQAVVVGLGLQ